MGGGRDARRGLPGTLSLPRLGVIAIGSNSVRMLTANPDRSLSDPERGREDTALFLSMDDKKRFSEEGMERCARAVSKLHYLARQAGAEQVRLIATSAVRDAVNRHELDFYIGAIAPMMITRIISGEEEAQLSFLGATGIPPREGLQGMIDIGGGSTEVALGRTPGSISFVNSLQLGASRLLQRRPIHGPEDLAPARDYVSERIEKYLPALPDTPKGWSLVGGTGTTLVNMIRKQPWDRFCPEEYTITRGDVAEWTERLAAMPAEERARLAGMPPARVHIMPTGLVILDSLMQRLSIDEIRVTRRNNLDGYLYRLFCCPEEDPDA